MSFVKNLAKNFLFGGVIGSLFGKKKQPLLTAQPQVTRDDAAEEIAADDDLRRRKGAAADMITGTRGASASAGAGRLIASS